MKANLFIATLITTILLSGHTFAGERKKPLELKSEGLAWVLGLDPIPGDALFYAEKPVQGTINSLMGIPGGALFWYGLIKTLTHTDRGCTGSDLSSCDWSRLGYGLAIAGGGLLYFPALIWDAIGGISGVHEHNAQVRKQQSSVLSTFRPTLAVTNEGVFAGAEFNF